MGIETLKSCIYETRSVYRVVFDFELEELFNEIGDVLPEEPIEAFIARTREDHVRDLPLHSEGVKEDQPVEVKNHVRETPSLDG